MTPRAELIRLMREEFDPTPKGWEGRDWNDNAEDVADKILALTAAPASAAPVDSEYPYIRNLTPLYIAPLAAPVKVPDGWQLIETAPKESSGSFSSPCLIGSVEWGKDGRVHRHVGPIIWQGAEFGWEFTEIVFDIFPPPTHWQPWPAAPKGDGK